MTFVVKFIVCTMWERWKFGSACWAWRSFFHFSFYMYSTRN